MLICCSRNIFYYQYLKWFSGFFEWNDPNISIYVNYVFVTIPVLTYGGVFRVQAKVPSSEPSPRTARQIRINFILFIICKCELVNWGRESREPFPTHTLSRPVYTCSLHAFSLVGQLSDREKTSPPNSKRFRDWFKSDRSNHLSEMHSRWSVNASVCWNHICTLGLAVALLA